MSLNIGLFGFGCVGQGFYEILAAQSGHRVSRIAIKDKSKARSLDAALFTDEADHILSDPSVSLVVEAITDVEQAFEVVRRSLERGCPVVSANKKMIATYFRELVELQARFGTPLLYDAAVCGSIPIIHNLRHYYGHDRIEAIEAICNGTTNYILTQVTQRGISYAEALAEAQAKGFAELDPTLDVQGYDPKYKLIILMANAFGLVASPDAVWNYGIAQVCAQDLAFAESSGRVLKLLARARHTPEGIVAYVAPVFLPAGHPLAQVHEENNAVRIDSAYAQGQYFVGKGAGSLPTGMAVFSDVCQLVQQPQAEAMPHKVHATAFAPGARVQVYVRTRHTALLERIEERRAVGVGAYLGWARIADLQAARLNELPDTFVGVWDCA